ncbi:MAG: InlB B-repeat-containing protein [Oscillospiraceae bacterium]|nr:InlB B-repeat-containing protein [Oscillospiraceae bacterium]
MNKRVFALLLCVLMCMTMLPVPVFAEGESNAAEMPAPPASESFSVVFDAQLPYALPETQIVAAGGFVQEPAEPTAQCLRFIGWFMDPEGMFPFDFGTPVLGDMMLYAGWEDAHSWGEGIVSEPATCTVDGVKTFACPVCGAVKTEAIPALGHQWGEAEITTPATCTEAGEKVTRCLRDSSHVGVEAIPATGHQWGTGEVTKAATCTEAGERSYTCALCGEKKTEEIPAAGHVLVPVEAKAATCTEDGVKSHYECKVCGAVFFDQTGSVAHPAQDAVIEATHVLEHVDAVEGGLPEHWLCTECGKMFSDEYGNGEIKNENAENGSSEEDQGSVKAQGEEETPCEHKLKEYPAKEATCKKAGNIQYWQCTVCKKYFSDAAGTTEIKPEDTVIKKLEHQFVNFKCILCGEMLLDYLGNNYDEERNPHLSPTVAHYGCTYSIIYHVPYNKSNPPAVIMGDGVSQWVVPQKNPETGATNYQMKKSSDGKSTIITFSKSFIRSLRKNGTYLVAMWDGSTYISNILEFKVSSSPLTGDESNIGLWIAIGVISAAALAGIATYLIRSRKKNSRSGRHGGQRKR